MSSPRFRASSVDSPLRFAVDPGDRGSWTYDEKRADPVACACGRMVHNGTVCARLGRCVMADHPHDANTPR